jgi:hypothetical protein
VETKASRNDNFPPICRATASRVQSGDLGDCQFNASFWRGFLKNNPTAKQPALACTGKGANLLFQKNQSRVKGYLNAFRGRKADRAFHAAFERFDHFHSGPGQSIVQLTGHSARTSGVDGAIEGLIVVKLNGEGRSVPSRKIMLNPKL